VPFNASTSNGETYDTIASKDVEGDDVTVYTALNFEAV
jgi:hypothetical protein